jgi:hypothetical protein
MLGPFGESERQWQQKQQDRPEMWTTGGQKIDINRASGMSFSFFLTFYLLSYSYFFADATCHHQQSELNTHCVSSLFHLPFFDYDS